jgi:hypothetical protein
MAILVPVKRNRGILTYLITKIITLSSTALKVTWGNLSADDLIGVITKYEVCYQRSFCARGLLDRGAYCTRNMFETGGRCLIKTSRMMTGMDHITIKPKRLCFHIAKSRRSL